MHRSSIELQNLIEPQKPSFCQTRVTGSTGLNVLSLFDGMSCGQLALQKAGIKVNQYFASEIKPHAIKVTQHNFPNTIQLGSVLDVKASDLPKIDLLIGGSPCQDFSSANKEKLGLQGEKSGLFYEYLRLLKECEPKYFLLENVAMDDYSYAAISEMLGTYPTNINSELVSYIFLMRKKYFQDFYFHFQVSILLLIYLYIHSLINLETLFFCFSVVVSLNIYFQINQNFLDLY